MLPIPFDKLPLNESSIGGSIKDGDKVWIWNRKWDRYLTACGSSLCNSENYRIFGKGGNPDPATGSGTWEIRSVNEPNMGGTIKDGDKIHVISQFESKSYLDVCFNPKCAEALYSTQTSASVNCATGTWEILLEL